MFVICLTGTLATVSNEIDWLLNPLLRVEAQDEPIAWEAMSVSFAASYPDSRLGYLQAPLYANFASIGLMYRSDGVLRRVFFDPYTGEVRGDLPWPASAQRILRDMHRFLFFPVSFGAYLVSSFGVVMLISVVTAFFVYKKWWRGFFQLRFNRGWRILFGDLHRLLGVWSLWFLLIIGATGVWYLVERVANDTGYSFNTPTPISTLQEGDERQLLPLSRVLEIVSQEMPDLQPRFVSLGAVIGDRVQPALISGRTATPLVRDAANRVVVNPISGDVVMTTRASEQGLGFFLLESMDPLHFGDFAGIVSKAIYFLFGLFTLLMSATGIWMWLRRNNSREQRGLDYSKMGWLKHTSLFVVTLGISWGVYTISSSLSLFQ